jgi:hypothetical protein
MFVGPVEEEDEAKGCKRLLVERLARRVVPDEDREVVELHEWRE